MQGIYTYILETNHVPREYNVAAILSLLFMVPISLYYYYYYYYYYIEEQGMPGSVWPPPNAPHSVGHFLKLFTTLAVSRCDYGHGVLPGNYFAGTKRRIIYAYYFFLWLCNLSRAMASSFTRFRDHTHRRATFGRTPLEE
jgi:hypothetical protein